MLFIPGHKFVFNPAPAQNTSSSIQQQLAFQNANRGGPSAKARPSGVFDEKFVPGHQYRLARIQKLLEDRVEKILYIFTDLSDATQPDIKVDIADSRKGDDYIAAMSGQMEQLRTERQRITQSHVSNTDF